MKNRANAPFDVTGWDQTPDDSPEGGPQHGRATVTKAFRGDLEGESVATLLMCQNDPSDLSAGAGYVASERVTAKLAGRSGTFVLQHMGLAGGGNPPVSKGHVVPGSGTGDLVGLTGEFEIKVDENGAHSLHLDYEID